MKTFEDIILRPEFLEKINTLTFRKKNIKEKTKEYVLEKTKYIDRCKNLLVNKAKELALLSESYEWLFENLVGDDKKQNIKSYIESLLNKRDIFLQQSLGIYIEDEQLLTTEKESTNDSEKSTSTNQNY